MAKRWTEEEIAAWQEYFKRGGLMPKGRELEAALRKIDPRPRFVDLAKPQFHAMSTAIFPLLKDVPYKGAGCHTDFIERVERCAVEPWKIPRGADDIFVQAVVVAREALQAHV